jgi:uncharacterized protein
MGAFETRGALQLLDRFPGLRLDMTMAMTEASSLCCGIDPGIVRNADLVRYADRILFRSKFPNLPYPYEAERSGLWGRDLPLDVYRRIKLKGAAFQVIADGRGCQPCERSAHRRR